MSAVVVTPSPVSWTPVTGQYTPPCDIPNVICIRITLNNMPLDRMPVVMGSQGKCFKAITEKTGAHYVWWKKEEGVIEVWGFFTNATKAVVRINNRLTMVRSLPDEKIISRGSSLASSIASSLASSRMMSPVNVPETEDSSANSLTILSPISLPASPLSDAESTMTPVQFTDTPTGDVQMLKFGDFPPGGYQE